VNEELDVVVIGAGFGGLAIGRELKARGHEDFLIVDRAPGLGGTWRYHDYPNVAADTPVDIYTSSRFLNPDWSRNYAPGAEILEYAEGMAKHFGLLSHMRFETEIVSAHWQAEPGRWLLRARDGLTLRPRFLFGAVGVLDKPYLPPARGQERFRGPLFHSGRWRHDVDLTGKRVALVGGGASSIQILPAAAEVAEHVTAFVPTPSYVVPKQEVRYTPEDRQRFRDDPDRMLAARQATFEEFEELARAMFPTDDAKLAQRRAAWRDFLHAEVADPVKRRLLTPQYEFGCRRILRSNDYYRAAARDEVTILPNRLAELTETSARADDGTEVPADVVILATGYRTNSWFDDVDLVGRDGVTLRDRWATAGPQAYLGVLVDGFPNLFLLSGPNSLLNAVADVYEAQAGYAVSCLELVNGRAATSVEVTPQGLRRYNERIEANMAKSVHIRCDSFYRVGMSGRNVGHYPGPARKLITDLREPALADLTLA
jgi:cation diffusion facilitator CzcD-associated flavoprotein CzcO